MNDIDMEEPTSQLTSTQVYKGAIFTVEDRTIALAQTDGGHTVVRRQVVRHAPVVVMLVHDLGNDRYLLEKEYRAGPNRFTYGVPAGLMNTGETVEQAALRELAEETGVVPVNDHTLSIDHVGAFFSSEGMSDELANIMVMHVAHWKQCPLRLDHDECVHSFWVSWQELSTYEVTASNAIIAIQYESLRRHRRHQ